MLYNLIAERSGTFLLLLASNPKDGMELGSAIEKVRVLDSTIWAVDKHGTRHIGQADVDKLSRVITAGIVYFLYIADVGKFAVYYANSSNPRRSKYKWYTVTNIEFKVNDYITLTQAEFTLLDMDLGCSLEPEAFVEWDELKAECPLAVVTVEVTGDVEPGKLEDIKNRIRNSVGNMIAQIEVK